MQLKKLTLQAFGPFKDKVVIDFEGKKIDKGLLLISGDTGAGKTTIFDAICYALYGQTSGETRTANSLRSDWASPDIDTFVDLEFYYKNKLYEVRRSPEYNRRKKNGGGETKQAPTAEINLDGRIVTKVTDVTKEIVQLIGLDYKQFRQVAMLSQGEFTKFLLANSEEKTTIFRKIFGTDFYDILQNKLKSNRLIKEDEIKRVKDKIDTEKKNLESIIDVFGLSNEETISALNNKIKADNETVLLTKAERDKKNEEKTKLNTELTNLNKINKDIATYQKAIEDLDKLLSSNSNIKNEKEKYDYNVKVANTITSLLDLLSKDSKSLEDKKNKEVQNKKDLENKQKEYKEKEKQFNKLDNYSKDVDVLNDEINDLTNKNKDYDNYLNKTAELNIVEKEYKVMCDDYDNQNSLYESMKRKYYLNISVEIADTLIDGEECPVCGSKEHPKKAVSNECEYTKEDLEHAEKQLKNIDNLRKTKEATIEQVRKVIKEYNIPENIDVSLEKNKNAELLEEKNREKEHLSNEFKKLSEEKQKLLSDIKSFEGNIKIFEEDIKKLEDNIKDYNTKLDYTYKENNTNYEDYISKKLDKDDLYELKTKIEIFDNTKNDLESTIKLLEQDVKGKKVVDVSEKEEQLAAINEEYKNLDEIYTKLNASLEILKSSTANIEKYLEDNKKIQSEYDVIKVLSDTANGSLTGKQRITFENYVQSYFMKTVLVEANKRLIKMTDSRYELKRKEIETKLNVKTGLDFSIFDSYTGKERDVASLSGGEKFKASLALALGLSDAISNNRGGIKIDSLFIDEGFGSLDSESLNQALNILSDLSGNDKLVGVISHVSELMSRIDNKILVNKTNTGSVVNVETTN